MIPPTIPPKVDADLLLKTDGVEGEPVDVAVGLAYFVVPEVGAVVYAVEVPELGMVSKVVRLEVMLKLLRVLGFGVEYVRDVVALAVSDVIDRENNEYTVSGSIDTARSITGEQI